MEFEVARNRICGCEVGSRLLASLSGSEGLAGSMSDSGRWFLSRRIHWRAARLVVGLNVDVHVG